MKRPKLEKIILPSGKRINSKTCGYEHRRSKEKKNQCNQGSVRETGVVSLQSFILKYIYICILILFIFIGKVDSQKGKTKKKF